ncbi:ankyrin repeat domain-containing protein [Streptomyces mirabilis]|uniref:ankyrin repeat domain-containing protein n=1 Tax=Streptomyces mirabilis TaxID=68239 RepID=UPI00379D88B3
MTQGEQGRDRMGRAAVHYAVVDGDVAGLRELLAGGADPDASDAAGWTPLHFAGQVQDPLAAEVLLAAGASVDAGAATRPCGGRCSTTGVIPRRFVCC